MNAATKKLTTAAVCTALAVIMCVLTAYLPLSFMPLYLAAFCIFVACKRGSLLYGMLCALASVGLMFLMTGLSVKWLMFVLMFAPYGIITYFLHRFDYFKVKKALVRAAIAVVFFNATFGIVYLITTRVLTVGIDGLDITAWADVLGGYPVLALIATVVLLPLDFMFSTMSIVVLKKIPAPVSRAKPPASEHTPAPPRSENAERTVRYDIFGYEISDDAPRADDNSEKGGSADSGETDIDRK